MNIKNAISNLEFVSHWNKLPLQFWGTKIKYVQIELKFDVFQNFCVYRFLLLVEEPNKLNG